MIRQIRKSFLLPKFSSVRYMGLLKALGFKTVELL